MARGQRSDPKKIERERKQAEADMARRETSKAPNPVTQVVGAVKARIKKRRERAAGFGPTPRIRGARVTGYSKPREDA